MLAVCKAFLRAATPSHCIMLSEMLITPMAYAYAPYRLCMHRYIAASQHKKMLQHSTQNELKFDIRGMQSHR